ncbi:hypothetical protein ISS03_03305 [Patescibacteria group bacterium]|nr:hypothetical protein [Patescibacteria group bacterium]
MPELIVRLNADTFGQDSSVWEKVGATMIGGTPSLLLDMDSDIPLNLISLVSSISLKDVFPVDGVGRVIGIYSNAAEFDDSRATVNKAMYLGVEYYELSIKGTSLNSIRRLYYAIRAGQVEPKESWEEKQIGLSAKNLNMQLQLLQKEHLALQDAFRQQTLDLKQTHAALGNLIELHGQMVRNVKQMVAFAENAIKKSRWLILPSTLENFIQLIFVVGKVKEMEICEHLTFEDLEQEIQA